MSLAENQRNDVACSIVNQRTFPGWGWMLENGATTLWEHWEFSDNTYSHNHPMFGSVSEWFYKALAGIRVADDSVACDHVLIAPQPTGDLTFVNAAYNSVRGPIVSNWERSGDQFRLQDKHSGWNHCAVVLPTPRLDTVTESGKGLNSARGLHATTQDQGQRLVEVGSGDYDFVCKLSPGR